jgi:hypothetical protein
MRPFNRDPPALSLAIRGGEGLGINFEFESPTVVEGGGIGGGPSGRAGELGNANGIREQEDEESELPWARCACLLPSFCFIFFLFFFFFLVSLLSLDGLAVHHSCYDCVSAFCA